ncbi:Intradiol ring-cleavage dioxygenase [Ilyonectria sp. MPI-CAGE-AT-0026]|nr:Intradiol ring-cleavage dioxygenase [Ilyonectria sp. MPI-CAGE-AT-0026]
MSHDQNGEPLLAICTVLDVKIDIWETDSSGMYDVQHAGREKPDGRCILMSDEEGKFWFKGIVPVPYPIPHDGPVGKLLSKPSHMHFMFEKEGWDKFKIAANS